MPTGRSVAYVVAQLLGGIAGALALKALVPAQAWDAAAGGAPAVATGITAGKAVLLEAVATFFLVWAVFSTAIDDRGPFAKTAGFTIGLTITFGILAIGPWTGAALNPARWLGPALVSGSWANWGVWIVGPLAGGVIAGELYTAVFLRGKEPATP